MQVSRKWILLALLSGVLLHRATAQVQAPPRFRRWEYKMVQLTGYLNETQFNSLGAQGWELAEVGARSENVSYYIFKRAH